MTEAETYCRCGNPDCCGILLNGEACPGFTAAHPREPTPAEHHAPHLVDGQCECDCARCTADADDGEDCRCICPDCDAAACGLHEPEVSR